MSPKPWAKLEIGYLDHPKFLALNANAICLWHEGKNYCDRHNTDGLIPRAALKGFRFRGKKSIAVLMTSCGDKPDGTAYAPLWDAHVVGYRMHDYLDHNDCRDDVLARIEHAEARREAERTRKAEWRAKKADKRVSRQSSRGTKRVTGTSLSRSTTASASAPETSTTDPPDRAPHPVKAFLALYESEFYMLHGDRPVVNGRDAKIAKTTIEQVGEIKAHVLLKAFFASDDEWIRKAGYGLNIFAGQLNKLIVGQKVAVPSAAWKCSHLEPCANRAMCAQATTLGRPLRPDAVAS